MKENPLKIVLVLFQSVFQTFVIDCYVLRQKDENILHIYYRVRGLMGSWIIRLIVNVIKSI
jgi:hypothetical protein